MTVNNKYQIGDRVYYINTDHRAATGVVSAIQVFAYSDHVNIYYSTWENGETHAEDVLFRTEAELRKDVFSDLLEFV